MEIYRRAFTEFWCYKDGVAFLDSVQKRNGSNRRLISENARDCSRRSRGGHHDQSFPSSSCTRRSNRFFSTRSFYSEPVACSSSWPAPPQFHFGGTSRSPREQLEVIAHLESEGETYSYLYPSLFVPRFLSLSPSLFSLHSLFSLLFSSSVDTGITEALLLYLSLQAASKGFFL